MTASLSRMTRVVATGGADGHFRRMWAARRLAPGRAVPLAAVSARRQHSLRSVP